jgi:hypothetical protein
LKTQVYYQCVFDYGTHKESVKYSEVGNYDYHDGYHRICFESKDGMMVISYNEENVFLTINESHLSFNKHVRRDNDYASPHGMIPLTTQIERLEGDEKALRFVYTLYQGNMLVSHAYMMVRLASLEDELIS